MKTSARGRSGWKMLLAVLVLALVATACGGTDDDGDAAGGEDPSDAADAADATDATESADGADTASAAPAADGESILIGLITKTDTNPFFVKMKEGAEEAAAEAGVELQSFAGEFDGDNESQVEAIENLVAAGAAGILITPSDPVGIAPTIQRARDEGVLVIALDTPTDPPDAVDITFATDNFLAGQLIGQWAQVTMEAAGTYADARIALLDLNPDQITVDVARDQGFLDGFGIDTADPNAIGDEDDPRIVGNDVTDGSEEGGRTAMENLLQRDQEINIVYTINEPAAAGAYEALAAVGVAEDVVLVSVDGGCPGVQNVADGVIGATSMQFPLDMASLGVQAVVDFATDGTLPETSEGLDFFNTGVTLITDNPVDGVDSITSAEGLDICWG